MSPLLGFTVFRDRIESGEKRQTIRLVRKRLIKPGDRLYLYWRLRTKQCRPLAVKGLGSENIICKSVERRQWGDMRDDEALARADGFDSQAEFRAWFEGHYHPLDSTAFDIISW